jgi:hypothetical protein
MRNVKALIIAAIVAASTMAAGNDSTAANIAAAARANDIKHTLEGASLVAVGFISAGVTLGIRNEKDYRGKDRFTYQVSACVSVTALIAGVSLLLE